MAPSDGGGDVRRPTTPPEPQRASQPSGAGFQASSAKQRPQSGVTLRRQVWIDIPDAETHAPMRHGHSSGVGLAVGTPTSTSTAQGNSNNNVSGSLFASLSSPTLGGSLTASAGCLHSRTGRFSDEEKICFKRLPTPSSGCEDKACTYFATVGKVRQTASEKGLCSLPVNKGEFHNHPGLKQISPSMQRHKHRTMRRGAVFEHRLGGPLEIEEMAAYVLEEIYPVSPEGGSSPISSPYQRLLREQQKHNDEGIPRWSSTASAGGAARKTLTGRKVTDAKRPLLLEKKPDDTSGNIMANFRMALLDKFSTVKEAIETLTRDVPVDHNMTKAEWRNLLKKHDLLEYCGRKEIDMIFKKLDVTSDNLVSLREVHVAVEGAAPVRSIEALRRRWLAGGYKSMNQAMRTMSDDDPEVCARRLSPEEFGSMLMKTKIEELEEHRTLFNAICSDGSTTSLEELHCAIAAVSPSLLLEDLRVQIMRKHKGDLDKALLQLDRDREGSWTLKEFVTRAGWVLDIPKIEAEKAFREIDLYRNGEVTMEEMKHAFNVVEPSLFYEDLRWKVRQRFHAISAALNKAFADEVLDGADVPEAVSKQRFKIALMPLGLLGSETDTLFDLFDVDGDGELTCFEFISGVRRFAPAYVLEDLRVRCWQLYGHVHTAFSSIKKNRSRLTNAKIFIDKLAALGLAEKDPQQEVRWQSIFDLVDIYHRGEASIGRLVAALSASGAGSAVKLPTKERLDKSREDVVNHLLPFNKKICDFKTQVRYGRDWDTHGHLALGKDRGGKSGHHSLASSLNDTLSKADGHHVTRAATNPAVVEDVFPGTASEALPGATADGEAAARLAVAASGGPAAQGAPRLRTTTQEQLPEFVRAVPILVGDCKSKSELRVHDIQDTFSSVWSNLSHVPAELRPEPKIQKNLQHYFESAAMRLSERVPYTEKLQSRLATYENSRTAQGALRPPCGKVAKGRLHS
mmetsp:Transcript_2188/g.6231  ORF Transcript_2188/g.6231 Transcript_2188/m.6231 type:complete len:967 (-) Transcript_2188:194-3094(-)